MSYTTFQLLMAFGILVGVALSVVVPYFRKLYEGKITSFDYKYLYQAVGTAVLETPIPILLDWGAPDGIYWVLAFILAVAFGFGGKDLQDQVYKFINRQSQETTT